MTSSRRARVTSRYYCDVSRLPDLAVFSLNFPPELTGIAPYVGALAGELIEKGYCVTAHVAHPHYPEWKIYDGYGGWTQKHFHNRISVRRRRHYVPRSPRGFRRLLSELTYGARIIVGKLGRPDLVIAVSPPLFATALATLRFRLMGRNLRSVIWVQDLYALGLHETGEGGKLVSRLTRFVESQVLKSFTHVVVIHKRFADYASDVLGVDPMKITIIKNWSHLKTGHDQHMAPEEAKALLGWPSDTRLAIHTGNMGVKQGLENIVKASALADDAEAPIRFVLIGDGSEREKLEARSRSISRLTILPPLPESEYFLALLAADVLLVNEKPGVASMAVPSKLTSYLHAGRPIVAATDIDGITAGEIAASKAGIVVPAGQPSLLLGAVLGLMKDPGRAAELSANGRRYREHTLSQRAAIEQWETLIREVLCVDNSRR